MEASAARWVGSSGCREVWPVHRGRTEDDRERAAEDGRGDGEAPAYALGGRASEGNSTGDNRRGLPPVHRRGSGRRADEYTVSGKIPLNLGVASLGSRCPKRAFTISKPAVR